MPNEAEYVYFALVDTLKHFAWYAAAIAVLLHLCRAVSLWVIAGRRELKGRWTAWIPVLNMWLLGSIADQYRYVVKGEVSCKRGGLLWAALLERAVFVLVVLAMVFETGKMIGALEEGLPLLGVFWIPVKYLKPNIQILAGYLLSRLMLLEVRTVVLHDVYRSCDPDEAVVSTILSVLPVAGIFFRPLRLWGCRREDYGMPPRRDEFDDEEIEWYYEE